jgi:hypothetical protein
MVTDGFPVAALLAMLGALIIAGLPLLAIGLVAQTVALRRLRLSKRKLAVAAVLNIACTAVGCFFAAASMKLKATVWNGVVLLAVVEGGVIVVALALAKLNPRRARPNRPLQRP